MPTLSTPDTSPIDQDPTPFVSVVIPCLNEARNLKYVFSRMPACVDEVVIVDGGSIDQTVERARELWPTVRVVHQTRTGKGNALACGFQAASGDIVVMLDADGSTDPAEIPRFVHALTHGAEFAKGSRFLAGGSSSDITRLRKLGNDGLSSLVNLLFRTRFSDLCYGYNAFWRSALPFMDLPDPAQPRAAGGDMLWGDGFEIETLINIRVAAAGLRVREVPSAESARIHGVSNLNAYRDGKRVLFTIVREFRKRRSHLTKPADFPPLDQPRPRPTAPQQPAPAHQQPGPRPHHPAHAPVPRPRTGDVGVGCREPSPAIRES